jgi:ATP:guanido phosphotransferase, C-terminal catalytic domain
MCLLIAVQQEVYSSVNESSSECTSVMNLPTAFFSSFLSHGTDWPDGRGIFHNKDKTFLVWVNEEDHMRCISMQVCKVQC